MTELSSRRLPLWFAIAFTLYAGVTLWLTLHHEAWCDEADTWLLMRDGGVGVMLERTGYTGTPALWYLLLAPLASSGLPYLAQQILNLLLAWCAMLLFTFLAPFRPALKILFLFSYYAACEYAVQARPYALLIALLFGIAATWRERGEKPLRVGLLTALLANTSIHGLLIAAVIGALFLGELVTRRHLRRRTIGSVTIMLAGGLLAAAQLPIPRDGPRIARYVDPETVPYVIGNAFLPGIDPRWSFAVGLVILLLAVLTIGHRVVPLLFVTLSIASLVVLFVFVWVGGTRHTGLILMVLLAGIWMARSTDGTAPEPLRASASRLFEAGLMLTFVWGIYAAAQETIAETKWAHSGSREMAGYIGGHVPPETVIAAHPAIQCEPVLAYLPGRKFWYIAQGRLGSYMTWDRAFDRAQLVPMQSAVEMAQRQFGGKRWLLLVNMELPPGDRDPFRLLYTNQRRVYAHRTERYWLYAPAERKGALVSRHLSAE